MTEQPDPVPPPLRVAFVPGVSPDTWARRWRERVPRVALELVALDEAAALAHDRSTTAEALALLDAADVDMALVRLPLERPDLHVVRLYEEVPVVVVPREHPVAAYDDIDVAELADEHLLQPPEQVPEWAAVATEVTTGTRFPVPPMTTADTVATIGAGTGIAILPMSLARLHARKDVVARPVHGVAPGEVGLVWPRQSSDARTDYFLGIARGRTANSSRSTVPGEPVTRPDVVKKAPGKKAGAPRRQQRGPRRTGRR